jgi:hypothetical protein
MRNTIGSLALFGALLGLAACNDSGTDNLVTVTSSVPGTLNAVVGSGHHTVALTFNTNDGKAASNLMLELGSLPSGWSAPAASFGCTTVSTGNGCVLELTYAPPSAGSGTLTLQYGYNNDAGAFETGTVQIPYQATANNNVVAAPSPMGQVSATVGGSRPVTVTFDTDDGNPAANLLLTTDLNSLPSGWSAHSTSFSCASVSTGDGCQLALTYTPTATGAGTLTLSYTYLDNAGAAQTGALAIAYVATTNDNAVTAVNPTGTVTGGLTSGVPVTVTFTTDDGNAASALSIASATLSALPSGWSSGSNAFSCATFSTGSSCQLSLTFAPTTVTSGTVQLGYSYLDNAGTPKSGTVSIPYTTTVHLYVADQQLGIVMCSIAANGSLTGCTSTGSGFSNTFSVAFHGNFGYVADVGNNAVDLCPVNVDGTLGVCTTAYSIPQTGNLEVNGSYLYIPWGDPSTAVNGPTVCTIGIDGSLNNCSETGADPSETSDVAFFGQYAYVSTYAQHGAGLLTCAAGSAGSLGGCNGVSTGQPQAFSTAVYQGNLYMTSNSGLTICAIASDGTLSNCTTSLPFAYGGSGWQTQYAGGFRILDGYAYLSYISFNFTVGVQRGVAVCTASADGSLANCADSGATFGAPFGIAFH